VSFGIGVASGPILALASGIDPIVGLLGGLVAVFVVAAALYHPQGLALAALVIAYSGLAIATSSVYVLAALSAAPGRQETVDLLGAAYSVAIAGLAATVVALPTSRGRAWVTVALTLTSPLHLGYLFLLIEPRLGLWAIYLAMATVLTLRSPLPAQLAAFTARMLGRHAPHLKIPRNAPGAKVLSKLPPDWFAIPGVKLRPKSTPVTVVVGPEGLSLVAFVTATGKIQETAATGVSIPGITVADTVSPLLAARSKVARWAGLRDGNVALTLVVGGARAGTFDRSVGLHGKHDGALPSARVRLVSEDGALVALTEPKSSALSFSVVARVARLAAGKR
jgi:hypothetical protein